MTTRRIPIVGLLLAMILTLAACGGSGAPSGEESGGDQTEPSPQPTITITSPAADAVISGGRSVEVTGTVSDASSVTVRVGDGDPVDGVIDGGSFSATVSLVDGANVITAAATGEGGAAETSVSVTYALKPEIAITSPEPDTVVTGSRSLVVTGTVSDATSVEVRVGDEAAVTATLDSGGYSASVNLGDRDNILTVTATGPGGTDTATVSVNYPFVTFATGQDASLAIGSPSLTLDNTDYTADETTTFRSNVRFESLQTLGRPYFDGARLYLADWFANHVVILNTLPTSDDPIADAFLGTDSGGVVGSPGAGEADLAGPRSISEGAGRLYVTEYSNDRVAVYDPIPSAAEDAIAVVGQAEFFDTGSGCAGNRLNAPEDSFATDERLIVADTANNRVLVFDGPPSTSNASASLVLGQEDMMSCKRNRDTSMTAAANTLASPTGVWTDGTRLVVADAENNRVLIWTEFPTENGEAADVVLGQPDMTTNAAGVAAKADELQFPYGVHSNGNQLAVADAFNHRVLIWNSFPTENGASADVVLGQSAFEANSKPATPAADRLDTPYAVLFGPDFLLAADGDFQRFVMYRPEP